MELKFSSRKKFGVLVTGNTSPYTMKKYGDYGKIFVELLNGSDEEWQVFNVHEYQFPSYDQLLEFDGFVVSGSRADAHANEEWIIKLCDILRFLHHNKIKVLGICFGHQVLSRALGGKTGRNPGGWDIGVKQISLNETLFSKSYGKSLPNVIKMLGTHRDQVYLVPPGAEILGKSKFTQIEMFCMGNHILGIQGHPEFRKDMILDSLKYRLENGLIPEDIGRRAMDSLATLEEDRDVLRSMCISFLKGSS